MEDPLAEKLEVAGHWRRASARWLAIMGYAKYTEEQREWLLRRREYCLAKIYPRAQPEKLDISEGRCNVETYGDSVRPVRYSD